MDHFNNYAQVDLDVLRHNFCQIRAAAGTPVMAVIKANAYGHGALAAAKALEQEAAFFGLAALDEALELRSAGIQTPILILGHMPTAAFADAIPLHIRPTISTWEDALALSQIASGQGVTARFHIAVDTGMGRIGFPVTEAAADLCQQIASLPNLELEGIFSHFATSDEADLSAAKAQAQRFDRFCAMLEERGVRIPIRHLDNSAGIVNFDNHYDMVRAGIILYGLAPSSEVDLSGLQLKPALSWHCRITHLKTLAAGMPISYGGTFVTSRPTRVATLSVGYADGYRRCLSNRFYVLIRGQKAPILGRVCMDQLMVDVTDLPDVSLEDTAMLLGPGISAEEMADAAQTINYEIVCGIGHRVPRIYTKSGQAVQIVNYLTE